MKYPPAFWHWAKWVDGGRKGPRPKDAPRVIPPHWWARYLIHGSHGKPKPVVKPSVFSQLGGFVAQAGSFPPDTTSAKAFVKSGGKWLAVQFGDPTTDQRNRQAFSQGWAERWRAFGVKVGCWWRVEHVGIPYPATPPVDFRIPNPEQQHELERLPGILAACRKQDPSGPLAVITLGKVPNFPTGLMDSLDAHLILECFLETDKSDTTVTNSVRYFVASQVPLHRIHACLLHKTGESRYPTRIAAAEAHILGVKGLSSFTAENTPADAWQVMA